MLHKIFRFTLLLTLLISAGVVNAQEKIIDQIVAVIGRTSLNNRMWKRSMHNMLRRALLPVVRISLPVI